MNVLATRVLSNPDKNGEETEVVLTVFRPFEEKFLDWRCGFIFAPSPPHRIIYSGGVDFIQALLICLKVARGYFEGPEPVRPAHWQGMRDFGLPWHVERPASWGPANIPPPEGNEGTMEVLTTRVLSYPDESRGEREILLTVFVPFKAEGEVWKCGFTFDPLPNASVRYGVGADFIEALLDCLASARVTYEKRVPKGWVSPSRELPDCGDFPYKIGRSFYTDPAGG